MVVVVLILTLGQPVSSSFADIALAGIFPVRAMTLHREPDRHAILAANGENLMLATPFEPAFDREPPFASLLWQRGSMPHSRDVYRL